VPLEAVAVTWQFPADTGALNTPALVIVPQLAVHVTGWLAVNVCVFIACRFVAAGVIVMGELTVTVARPALPPAVGVAVTVQDSAASGAVYNPAVVTDPQPADHVALALAVNCCEAASLTVAELGEMIKAFIGAIVSRAVAVYAVPLAAVAWIEQTAPGVPDAVNNPALDIDPHDANQVTGALAVNCWVEFWLVAALAGVIVMGELTVTAAEAALLPAVGVAVTVQDSAASGAVYNPAVVTDPQLADHVALALAVNCCVPPSLTVALAGETVIEVAGATVWS